VDVVPKWLGALLGATSVACGGSLPEPEFRTQPLKAFEEVPYPPPAPLAEAVPRLEGDRAVWIDGYWAWRGSKYTWLRGGWVLPPAGARYAPWQLRYRDDGALFFAQPSWYGPNDVRLRKPETLLPARTPSDEVTSEDPQSR